MTRLAPFLSLAILLSLLESSLAGPACARRNYQAEDCIQKCGQMWGWPGMVMQQDPWGGVMKASFEDMNAILSKACGISTTAQSTPSSSATQTIVAVQSKYTEAPTTTSVRTTLTAPASSSASSSVITNSTTFSNTTTSVRTTSSSSSPTSSSTPTSSSFSLINEAIATSSFSFPPTSTAPPAPTSSSSSTPPPAPSSSSQPPAPKPSASSSSSSQAAPSPSPSSSQGPGSGSGSTSGGDIDQYLSAHNSVRAQHGASALSWSDNLAGKAQQWANGCKFQHSGGSLGPFGENLAAGTGDSYDIAAAVKSWTDEVSEYDPNNPQASHFTQVVWKGSSQVGCALQLCDGIFAASFGKAKYYVCEYSSQGNVIGQFAQNVQV